VLGLGVGGALNEKLSGSSDMDMLNPESPKSSRKRLKEK